jgi:class 3 adenylate cyclase
MTSVGADVTVPREIKAAVMFIDVEGFSRISGKKSPSTVFEELRQCLVYISDVVSSHGGTVNKILGNGLLCFFHDPKTEKSESALAEYSAAALRAAIQIQRDLARQFVNSETSPNSAENKKWHALPMRIGVNAGNVLVGDLSVPGASHGDVTLVGETVNLAKRLESAADIFRVLVSPAVKSLLDQSLSSLDFGVGALWGRRFLQMKYQTGLFESWDCNPFGNDSELLKGALRLVRTGAKRASPRIPWLCQIPLRVSTSDGQTGRVVDFSENGFCIEFPSAFARKEQLFLTISTGRDDWNLLLQTKGLSVLNSEVRWVETVGQMNWHGVSFVSFSAETARALSEILIQFNNRASEEPATES